MKKTIETKTKETKVILEKVICEVMNIFSYGNPIFWKFKDGKKPEIDEILEMIGK